MSLYLKSTGNNKAPSIEHSIHQVVKEASLLYCIPDTPFRNLFKSGKLSGMFVCFSFFESPEKS